MGCDAPRRYVSERFVGDERLRSRVPQLQRGGRTGKLHCRAAPGADVRARQGSFERLSAGTALVLDVGKEILSDSATVVSRYVRTREGRGTRPHPRLCVDLAGSE